MMIEGLAVFEVLPRVLRGEGVKVNFGIPSSHGK